MVELDYQPSHGMFRLLPWPSAIGGNKMMSDDVKMLAPSCVNTLVPQLKRKRSDDSVKGAPAPTKIRTDDSTKIPSLPVAPSDSVTSPNAPSSMATPTRPPAQAAGRITDVDRLRDTITAQLSLEVLLKHNELRLIDQEIAKCQVSLEQLRRCAEIPYPGSSVAGISADVSLGTGASVLPGNGSAPMSPAPWGVTEGPYSRHYARWLLPDPRFDGEVDSGLSAGSAMPEGRSTRGNPVDFSSLAGKSRPSRGSGAPKLQSLPSGYPVVKEKAGPMIMRRKSDGLFVKLTCLDCQRVDFSSTQGFINHCRIAHNRNFASHDAAAQASGEPVEVDESGAIIGGRTESTTSAAASGSVHPLNRSSNLPTPTKESVTPKKLSVMSNSAAATCPTTIQRKVDPRRQSEPAKANNPSFLASPATPHLSAFMKSRGLGLNMEKLVQEAKTPVDLSGLSDDDSDMDESAPSSVRTPQDSQQGPRAARHPMRMPTAQDATDQSGGKALQLPDMTPTRPQSRAPYLADLESLSASAPQSAMDTPRDSMDHPAHLSPNTVESNQAPSLVSDDEDDYEVAFDSDSPSSSEAEDNDEEFRHIEVQDDERTNAPSAPAEPKPGPSLANPMSQPAPPLPKQMKQGRSALPSFDRTRDDQFNPMRDITKPVNFTRPDFRPPSEDSSKMNRDNGRNPSPPFSR